MATAPIASVQSSLDPRACDFYQRMMRKLLDQQVAFLVGGAYAFAHYTGIVRHTKDFDIFVHPDDARRALAVLGESGCDVELTFPHWLGKAYCGEDFIDVIFSSGNGVARVDHLWFEHAVPGEVLGVAVELCPAEEMIWSKSFIMERERYDGADVAHLLRACAPGLDWERLLERFGDDNWRVLFNHLLLFGYIYPADRDRIPGRVIERLTDRLRQETASPAPADRVCRGTILSRAQYLPDVEEWGYRDARLAPEGTMSGRDVRHWTKAIEDDGPMARKE